MRNRTRKLALILCVIMLVSLLPASALAYAPGQADSAELVGYNLGKATTYIGTNEEQLLSGEAQDLFAEDGSYTIELENDAFFPYEVKFSTEDAEEILWFTSPESFVVFGGHKFYVHSEDADPTAITQIGVTVDGTYIPAYPAEKNFAPMMLLRSMIPLREVRAYLDLSGYLPSQLKNIPVQAVINGLKDSYDQSVYLIDGDVAVYARWGYYDEDGNIIGENDNYTLIDESNTLTLTNNMPYYYSNDTFTLELIVGTADQLNLDNVRYIVTVTVNSVLGLFRDMTVISGATSDRTPLTLVETSSSRITYSDGSSSLMLYMYYDDRTDFSQSEVLVSFAFKEEYSDWAVKVVEGLFFDEADVPDGAEDITSQIWDADLSADGGYAAHWKQVTFLLSKGDVKQAIPLTLYVSSDSRLSVSYYGLFTKQSGYDYNTVSVNSYFEKTGTPSYRHYHYTLGYGIPVDGDYSVCLEFNGEGSENYGRNLVERAYAAHYATVDDIPAEAEDIADKLFAYAGSSGAGYQADYSEGVEFTVLDKQGELHWIYVIAEEPEVIWEGFDYYLRTSSGSTIGYDWRRNFSSNPAAVEMHLYSNSGAVSGCFLSINSQTPIALDEAFEKTVVGDYATAASIPANAENITDQLFSNNGYPVNFNSTVSFTVLDKEGIVHRLKVTIPEAPESVETSEDSPLSQDTYFRVNGVTKDPDASSTGYYQYWVMPYDADSYYYNGYQTILLLRYDYNTDQYVPVTDENIVPYFYTGNAVKMYAGIDNASGTEQISGTTKLPFTSGSPIQYSAASEDAGHLKNYWVTFLTQQSGPKLFVNGTNDEGRYVTELDADGNPVLDGDENEVKIPSREIFIIDDYGNKHDVFFANIGDEEIDGLYARLEDPQGVTLDDYWKIGETTTLSAFTTTDRRDPDGHYVSYGELANVGKIRILPITNEDGSVDFQSVGGTLFIGYDSDGDGEPEEETRIKLTGIVGDLLINTETLSNGVKFVPYSQLIQTNNMYADDAVHFAVSDGSLPAGLSLRDKTGELYGLPTETGTFTFTVQATATYGTKTFTAEKEYTLEIKDNTDENVDSATDEGYEVLTVATEEHPLVTSEELVERKVTEYKALRFVSEGDYSKFVAFYLDGVKLSDGTDFNASEGSAVIDILEETISNAGNGTHTLAMEFRDSGSDSEDAYSPMHRTSRNLEVTVYTPPYNPDPTPTQPVQPTQPTDSTYEGSADGPVPLEYVVDDNGATVKSISEARETALDAERNPDAIVDLSENIEVDTIILPAEVVDKLAEKLSDGDSETGTLIIKLSDTVLTLDETTIQAIKEQADNGDTTITVTALEQGDLTDAQKSALDDRELVHALRVMVAVDGKAVESFNGGRVTIYVTFTPTEELGARDVSAFYLAEDGRLARHATDFADGQLSFRTAHFSDFVIINDSKVTFDDVADGSWYTGVVDFAARSGLMIGTGKQRFAPEAKLTRAMMTQVLYNLESEHAVITEKPFTDVADDAWYADAVNWAAQVGVVNGMGNGIFAPNVEISREQLAVMMYNYAVYKGYSVTRSADTSRFTDSADVSSWAQIAMSWAIGEKLFAGLDTSSLAPGDGATRAQTAKVLAYFLESFVI